MAVRGIDISKWQGVVDFAKVKADGYSFVILNAGYGRYANQKDPYFEQNYKNAKAVGLNIGAYWYSYAHSANEARQEARVFLDIIKGKTFEYPVAYDIEENSQGGLGRQVCSDMTRAFIGELEKAGYYAVMYSYTNFLNSKIDDDCKKRYDVWVAEFNVAKPSYNGVYGMWQHTSTGKVKGVSGDCDCNYAYKDYPKIMKENGFNGFKKTVAQTETTETTPFDKYFAERIGKGLDYDGVYGVMCFDLVNDYSVNLIGGKAFIGMSAYEIYTNFANQPGKELYERIPNTPDFVPIKGDIMVWGQSLGKHGHVAICNGEGDTTWFNSYDQNWTGNNDPVTLIKHNYNHVLGVLRPKDQSKVLGGEKAKTEEIKVKEKKANAPKTERMNGDINGDGKVNIADVTLLAAHVKGKKKLKD